MHDDFLASFRELPPSDFSDDLYRRISQLKPSLPINQSAFIHFASVLTALLIIMACVRAATVPKWIKIGDIWVDVHPKSDSGVPIKPPLFGTQELVSLPEAEQALDCVIKIPTWAPDQLTSDGRITLDADFIGATPHHGRIYWSDADGQKSIALFIFPRRQWMASISGGQKKTLVEPYTGSIVPGSYREVKVHGQPAVLVRGDWSQLSTHSRYGAWDDRAGLSLYWTDDDAFYQLYTASSAVSADDLIRMAESAR